MVLKRCPQPVDRIKCRRSYVVERDPVVRYEVSGFEPLEKHKRVTARQMAFAETGLPPGRMADWEKSKVQASPIGEQMLLDQVRCIRCQSCIAGKKARYFFSLDEIHISRTSPPIYVVAVTLMRCRPCLNL